MNIRIHPYAKLPDGTWSIPRETLVTVWDKLCEENKKDIVFYSGGMDTADQFIALMQSPHVLMVLVTAEGVICGCSWLTGMVDRHAMAHFFMSDVIRGDHVIEAGMHILTYWLYLKHGDQYVFDLLLGVTPTVNLRALRFIEKLGFSLLGKIPLICPGAGNGEGMISYLHRRQEDGRQGAGNA